MVGCSTENGVPGGRSGRPEDIQAVEGLIQDLIAADNAGDVDAVTEFYAVDATLVPPGRPLIAGEREIREHYRVLFDRHDLRISIIINEIRAGDRWAVVSGLTQGLSVSTAEGKTSRVNDRFMMVLRRDDRWRIIRLMWAPNEPDP